MYFGELNFNDEGVIDLDVVFESFEKLKEEGTRVAKKKEFTPYRSKVGSILNYFNFDSFNSYFNRS